jgi:hypothetical protein
VRALIDPQRRGRHHIETRLTQLVGTCAGGLTLTKQDATDGHGAPAFAVRATSGEGSGSSAESRRPREEGVAVNGTSVSNFLQTASSLRDSPLMADPRGHDDEAALARSQQGAGLITIDVGRGRIHVGRDFDAPTLERVLEVLDRRR